jgi:hypothetical protein
LVSACWGPIKTRRGRQRRWIAGSDYNEISLTPLTGETSAACFQPAGFEDLPEEVRKLILEKAEGNPFYVEEVIRSLIESGILVKESNGRAGRTVWRALREVDQINLPENLQTLLIARIDQLDEESRHTLQLASVSGALSTRAGAINQVPSLERDGLNDRSTPERAELTLKTCAGLEYTFRHSITQECHNTILVKQRRNSTACGEF